MWIITISLERVISRAEQAVDRSYGTARNIRREFVNAEMNEGEGVFHRLRYSACEKIFIGGLSDYMFCVEDF
jgi:hypothetical protein